MLEFRQSMDPHSEDIVRKEDDKPLGFLQWHASQGRRIILWEGPGVTLSYDELQQCVERLSGKSAAPGYNPEIELGREITKNSRKARVDRNRCADVDDGKEYAVFKRTHYMRQWYYDGYRAFDDLTKAIEYRDKWLNYDES